jgi:hypothetical protein
MYADIFGSNTTHGSWVPEPKTRGSWGILSSCIVTISLCVWTAVHLNIPEHTKKRLEPWAFWKSPQLHRKVLWLLLGLLAREIVAYTAWGQRQQAEALMKDVNKHYNISLPQTAFQKFCAWILKKLSKFFCFWRESDVAAVSLDSTCKLSLVSIWN